MHHHLECKAKVSEVLEEELNDLEHHVEKLSTESENLDVQIVSSNNSFKIQLVTADSLQIRASTQHKKFLKNIDKLKSLDVSHAKIEVSGNDKMKLAKKKTILHLMKKLSSTFLNKEDEGFVLNPRDLQIKQFHLNKNNSKQKNRDILWKHIGNSSRYNEEWNQLF